MDGDSSSTACCLRRARYSRAICHRADTLVTPPSHLKSKVRPYFVLPGSSRVRVSDFLVSQGSIGCKIQRNSANFFESADCIVECNLIIPHQSSRNSICSCQTHNISGSRNEEQKHMQRASSWSDLFRHSGGEHALSSAEKWMIDLSHLFLGQRLACGSYSRLYLGMYKGESVAIKVIRQRDDDKVLSDRLESLFRQEIKLHSGLHHKNIVKFLGACKKPSALCMLTEYMSGGSVREFLRKANDPLPLKQLVRMAVDIALGMEYMHRRGVIHRDLKSENLLLTHDFRVKVADFGVACIEQKADLMWDDPGTYRWMAPEMISRKSCTRKVDVFSFGFVLYELISRRVPFEEMNAAQAAYAVFQKNARPKIPPDCPLLLGRLICQCWSTNPKQRPEFMEVLRVLEELRVPRKTKASVTEHGNIPST